jgi:RNA polymerase sigma-70 factor (ECF subfamily)
MASTTHDGARAFGTADFGVLYTRYWDTVVAYLRGQGAREPEDLAAEVFIGVLRNLGRFEGDEAAFRSWLLVIAHRRLVDHRRAQARRPVDVREPVQLARLVDRHPAGNAEDEAVTRLATRRVVRALDQLTDEQRTVVLLHAVGDLSLPQIADALGKRLAAVKSLHHRGLAAAARALGDPSDWQEAG